MPISGQPAATAASFKSMFAWRLCGSSSSTFSIISTARFGSFFTSRCAFMIAIDAVETLKNPFFSAFTLVVSARRKSWRPVRNSGSCFRMPWRSEMA